MLIRSWDLIVSQNTRITIRQQVLVSLTNNIKIFLTETTVFRTKRIIDYETRAYNPMHRTQS